MSVPTYRVPPQLAWVDGAAHGMGEELYLSVLPAGRTVLLRDTARLIWLVAAQGSDDVARDVAHAVGLHREQVAEDVAAFVDDLVGRGLLEPED